MDEQTADIVGEDEANNREALLRDMIVRFNTFPGDPRMNNPHVIVGQLPEGLSFRLPVPPDSMIVGSLIRGPESASILINVDQQPQHVLAWYRQYMKEAGVQELEIPGIAKKSGFTQTGITSDMRATFCYSTRGPSLIVNVLTRDSEETKSDVRIELDRKGMVCKHFAKNRMQRPLFSSLIPQLAPPPRANQRIDTVGASSTGDSVYSIATLVLEDDMNVEGLASHYNVQLESGGWTRTDSDASGPVAWSTWSFHDEDNEPWYGSFFIFKTQTQQPQFTLYVQAKMETGESLTGGWLSSIAPLTLL